MQKFKESLKQLNQAQLEAVKQIEGPVLVTAGPGTGKTQLLSTRVANILHSADVTPNNILCLTFTDNAARNMLERLETMIGQPAYHVGIHTFHSFGSEVINFWPEFFAKRPLLQPIDQLGSFEILHKIFEKLPHSNPIATKLGDDFIYQKDASKTISWLKHNAISPEEFKEFIAKNKQEYKAINSLVHQDIWSPVSQKHLTAYEDIAASLAKQPTDKIMGVFSNYSAEMAPSLEKAIAEVDPSKRHAPSITAWRNKWLSKTKDSSWALKDSSATLKLEALAKIYDKFQQAMTESGLYDFDDMIMEVVHALETEPELQLNLQEKYQYILVDEFQDTNNAQLRILKALGDNPVHEGRPNIMAVGDPNQAIYAFQGAASSNITNFLQSYSDVKVIELTENYRSTQNVLDASHELLVKNEADSIHLDSNAKHSKESFNHSVFTSELAQYQWVAKDIQKQIKNGAKPEEIAVIAPKHKYLERLMPYLASKNVPVAYERRENILEAPLILQLLTMAKLVDALASQKHEECDVLFSEVLSYNFFALDTKELISTSLTAYNKRQNWLPILLQSKNKQIKATAEWFVELSKLATTQPMEYLLDELSGVGKTTKYTSPFYQYFFGRDNLEDNPTDYLAYLGQLSTLRQKLRSWKPNTTLFISDLVNFVELHKKAGLKITDSNPHTQAVDAVQVMTAYKAKGLEFEYVYAINAQDEVWGPKARGGTDKIRLPKNLPIKPAGDNTADKLRLLYVAFTRAKHTLNITSYSLNLSNKKSLGISFIGGNQKEAEPIHELYKPQHHPEVASVEAIEILSTDWALRYKQIIADKPALFKPILERYKLSVTHLNNFLDVVNGGPQQFLMNNLLRFPQAMSPSAAYGDAMHRTIQWAYIELKHSGGLPSISEIHSEFTDALSRKHLEKSEQTKLLKRGKDALELYMNERSKVFNPNHMIERNFGRDGVTVGDAKLGGKVDKIITDGTTMHVVDFKTGKPSTSWKGKDEFEKQKLHRYKRQLIFYKILVEGSASFSGKYVVTKGALEFLEPNKEGELPELLEIDISDSDVKHLTELITAVWSKITNLDFPDTSAYPQNLKGMLQFEEDLLKK